MDFFAHVPKSRIHKSILNYWNFAPNAELFTKRSDARTNLGSLKFILNNYKCV
jgi:hypothetical protein